MNAADTNGRTPARLAAYGGHAAALEVLVKAGCNIDSCEGAHRPLCLAAQESHFECIRVLVRAGAELVAEGEELEDDRLDEDDL